MFFVLDVFKHGVDNYIDKINSYDFVKSTELNEGTLKIEFTEPVVTDGQDLFNLFNYGGVILRKEKNEKGENQFFLVE